MGGRESGILGFRGLAKRREGKGNRYKKSRNVVRWEAERAGNTKEGKRGMGKGKGKRGEAEEKSQ